MDIGSGTPINADDESADFGTHLRGRMLTSSQGSVANATGSSHASHGSHAQDALIFLFNAIIFGVLLLQLTTFPMFHRLQQTVALFSLGVLYSLVQEGLKFNEQAGVLGRSYDMWMHIDPHLMLFTMLPALLAGDAMSLDTSIVRKVAAQCIYLAGPGVIISSILGALFLKFYLSVYNWPFELCMVAGCILAATDPVAVVSLLKQLGAAPSLTILIQGESLLNDGTAIVCFVLSYDMLQGESYGFGEVIVFVVRKAICACGLGWVIGWIFVVWISAAGNRFEHHSSTLQVCLTLCCAYWSFIIAEGVLDMSGVLCTVSASLVLADNMWSSIVDKEVLLHVWHMVEFLGNTLVFFLAGALTGNCMVHIPAQDYLHLIVIYIVLFIIRGFVIIGSLPVLRRIGTAALPISEAIVMTWGGLRGAVGLALAIQVSIDRAGGKISAMDGRRVLFYTGGVAFFTLVINAVTCPALVKFLGLVQTEDAKRVLLLKVCSQMVRRIEVDTLKPPVRRALEAIIKEVDHSIATAYHVEQGLVIEEVRGDTTRGGIRSGSKGSDRNSCTEVVSKMSGTMTNIRSTMVSSESHHATSMVHEASYRQSFSRLKDRIRQHLMTHQASYNEGQRIVEACDEVVNKLQAMPGPMFDLLNVPSPQDLALSEGIKSKAIEGKPEPEVMECFNSSLLALVRAEYWHMIEQGEFIKGSSQPNMLLDSVTMAMHAKEARLADFGYLFKELDLPTSSLPAALQDPKKGNVSAQRHSRRSLWEQNLSPDASRKMSKILADEEAGLKGLDSRTRIINSTNFQVFITTTIVLNVINVFIEEHNMKGKSDNEYVAWLAIEICFNLIFIAEFVLKLLALGRRYFYDAWNVFDFLLVISGIFGIIVELAFKNDDAAVSSEARVFRINRIFRAMRLMRVFRLVTLLRRLRARWSGLELNMQMAKNMQAITMLSAFARAHFKAEQALVKFFGDPARFQGCEMARCILDSRTASCDAVCAASFEIGKLEIVVLERLAALRESGSIIEDLTQFIVEAGSMGVMNSKEAEILLEPLRGQQQKWFREGKHHLAGIYDRSATVELVEASDFRTKRTETTRHSLNSMIDTIENPFDMLGQRSESVVEFIAEPGAETDDVLKTPDDVFDTSFDNADDSTDERLEKEYSDSEPSLHYSEEDSEGSHMLLDREDLATPSSGFPETNGVSELRWGALHTLDSEETDPFMHLSQWNEAMPGNQLMISAPPETPKNPAPPLLNTSPQELDQQTAEEFVMSLNKEAGKPISSRTL